MSEPRFKIGDVVVLKSGGPPMTVFLVERTAHLEPLYRTTWFDGKKLLRDAFADPELELATTVVNRQLAELED